MENPLELHNLLKYGLNGFLVILAILGFWLLRNEQKKSIASQSPLILKNIIYYMIFCVIFGIMGFLGLSYESKDQEMGDEKLTTRLKACENEYQELRAGSVEYETLNNLLTNSGIKMKLDSSNAKQNFSEIINLAQKQINDEKQYLYSLYKLELSFRNYPKNAINTKPGAKESSEDYTMIQAALKLIEEYNGMLNSEREPTYNALFSFQEKINTGFQRRLQNPDTLYIAKQELGYFGYKMLNEVKGRITNWGR